MLTRSNIASLLLPLLALMSTWSHCLAKRCLGRDGASFSNAFGEIRGLSGCTIVERNVVIGNINVDKNSSVDLSPLENITEIKGLLYIAQIKGLTRFPLPSLRVVRGEVTRSLSLTSARSGQFSIILYDLPSVEEWPFVNLEEVTNGDVLAYDMPSLAHSDTLDWEDIQNKRKDGVVLFNVGTQRSGNDTCPSSCGGYCWSSSKCQTRSLKICSSLCSHRCVGSGLFDCCHQECVGSCSVIEDATKCSACRTFEDGNVCEDRCPSLTIYDRQLGQYVVNPDARYIFQDQCLAVCPDGLVINGQRCASRCPDGQEPNTHRVCVPCKGACPKVCDAPSDGVIDSNNLADFRNCTEIAGQITLNSALNEDLSMNRTLVMENDLEVFSQVRVISEYLAVFLTHSGITSLKFFRNLETIRGTILYGDTSALLVQSNPGLTNLGFSSLHRIENGDIAFFLNSKLCVSVDTDGLREAEVIKSSSGVSNALNNPSCNVMCHVQCNSSFGCWSPMNNETCVTCTSFDYDGSCVNECTYAATGTSLIYTNATSDQCLPCHHECATGCDGPGDNQCHDCKNVRDGSFCYPECPPGKYKDNSNVCQYCNVACEEGGTCTGPGDNKGLGGCDDCDLFFVNATETSVIRCVNYAKGCPESYYQHPVDDRNHTFFRKIICRRCHETCRECRQAGPECETCSSGLIHDGSHCVSSCSTTKYPDRNNICQNCPIHCGPVGCTLNETTGEIQCKSCDHLLEDFDGTDHCVETCSRMKPYRYDAGRRCYKVCPRDTYNFTETFGGGVCQDCSPQCRHVDAINANEWICTDGTDHETSCLLGCQNVEQRGICVAKCDGDLTQVTYRVVGGEEIEVQKNLSTTPTSRGVDEDKGKSIDEEEKSREGTTESVEHEEHPDYEIRKRCEVKDEKTEPTIIPKKNPGSENLALIIVGATIGFIVVVIVVTIVVLRVGYRW